MEIFVLFATIVQVSAAVNRRQPELTTLIKNVTVKVNQTAILPCAVENVGKFKVMWQKIQQGNQETAKRVLTMDNRRIISDDRITVERQYITEWNLHLRNVKLSDAGTYECNINTDPVQSSQLQLVVHVPPMIIENMSSPSSVRVREGETVELVCNATGTPPPQVVWFKIDSETNKLKRIRPRWEDNCKYSFKGIKDPGEVLVIHNASRACAVMYQCEASNQVKPSVTRDIQVHVEFPPEVTLPNKRISQSLSKPTILECTISAYPHNVNRWRHNGQDITRDQKGYTIELYKDGATQVTLNLRIHSVSPQDYGTYECYASNLLGKDSESMVLYEYRREKKTTTTTTLSPWVDPNNRINGEYHKLQNRNGNNGYYTGGDQNGGNYPGHHAQARGDWDRHSKGDDNAKKYNKWGDKSNREAESNSVRAGPRGARDSTSRVKPHSLLVVVVLHILVFYSLMS